jgi:hypothetical protein
MYWELGRHGRGSSVRARPQNGRGGYTTGFSTQIESIFLRSLRGTAIMAGDYGNGGKVMKSRLTQINLQAATVVLLLFAVTGLSTLAKNSQYFPNSNPAHYINISNKMKGGPAPVLLDLPPLYPIAKVVLPQPCAPVNHGVEEISPPSPSIGVTVSIQHRAPPPSQSQH